MPRAAKRRHVWEPDTSHEALSRACGPPLSVSADGPTGETDDAACFRPDTDWHEVLSPPGPSDWLAGPGEMDRDGQTFEEYQTGVGYSPGSRPSARVKRWLPTTTKRTLVLVPIAGADDPSGWDGGGTGPDLAVLADFVSRWFMVPCVVLPEGQEHSVSARTRPARDGAARWQQLRTTDIHDHLHCIKRERSDAYAVVGVTMRDLYTEDLNFVFGEANAATGTGVFSFARHDPSFPRANSAAARRAGTLGEPQRRQILLQRAAKTLVHEIGHLFSILHCVWYQCNMNGANTLEESDKQPLRLCPCDLRKVAFAVRYFGGAEAFRIRDRYKQLHEFYKEHGFESEASWTGRRLAALDTDAAAARGVEVTTVNSDDNDDDGDGCSSDDDPLPLAMRLAASAQSSRRPSKERRASKDAS